MKSVLDLKYGNLPDQILDIHLPDCEEFPVFLYFHGGGIESGGKGLPDTMKKYFTDHGIAIASANYRMYPDHKYPDYIEDAALAVAWLKNHISEYGKCTEFYVGGASAGGYLSMMLCFDKKWLAAHGVDSDKDITGYIHDAGQPTTHFNILRREYGVKSARVIIDEKAPLYHVGTNSVTTRMLFIVSDNDMPGRYEQTQLMMATLKHFGCDMEKIKLKVMHGTHVHYVGPVDENGVCMYGQIIVPFILENKI